MACKRHRIRCLQRFIFHTEMLKYIECTVHVAGSRSPGETRTKLLWRPDTSRFESLHPIESRMEDRHVGKLIEREEHEIGSSARNCLRRAFCSSVRVSRFSPCLSSLFSIPDRFFSLDVFPKSSVIMRTLHSSFCATRG